MDLKCQNVGGNNSQKNVNRWIQIKTTSLGNIKYITDENSTVSLYKILPAVATNINQAKDLTS